jgi:hypothetical protein
LTGGGNGDDGGDPKRNNFFSGSSACGFNGGNDLLGRGLVVDAIASIRHNTSHITGLAGRINFIIMGFIAHRGITYKSDTYSRNFSSEATATT